MPTFNEKFSRKRILKYFFFLVFVLWFITWLVIVYKYLLSFSNEKESKWWTFVEWIFSDTSYLPYLRNDSQSKFYQWLLFHWCLKYDFNKQDPELIDDLCHVTTTDYKTYYISLLTWFNRSDGSKVLLDDIFFTYNDVIKNNIWNIPFLNWYKEMSVSQTLDNRIKITFQNTSVDNNIFFTNYILPKHIVVNMNYEHYKQSFGLEPIYNQCSTIWSNTKDQYSLVFDVSECENTYIWFYQLKSNTSFDIFKKLLSEDGDSIIDIYEDHWSVTWYITQNVNTNKLVTIFFNTNSSKLQVRTRRVLWWLINSNFFVSSWNISTWYENLLKKYDKKLFSSFVSDWSNIKDFLWYKSSQSTGVTVSKVNLVWTDTKVLPDSITISWTTQKYAYYIENVAGTITLKLKFDQAYDKISIINNTKEYFPKSYNKNEKKAEYNISEKLLNLKEWLNKYEIFWYVWKDKISVATIDLYNLKENQTVTTNVVSSVNNDKIIVLYYNNNLYNMVVDQFKAILSKKWVLDYFMFQSIWSVQELEGKLAANEYDIVINAIDMWLKKDISKLFVTDKKEVNHSQYMNTQIASFLQQYYSLKYEDKTRDTLLNEINTIYGKDMPFVVLGTAIETINIKHSTYKKLFWLNSTLADKFYDYNRRHLVYENLVLANNANIDITQAQDFSNFVEFIKNGLK